MSIANAISVRRAARKDRIDAIRVTVTWVEQEKSNAMKVTAVADGKRIQQKKLHGREGNMLTNGMYSESTSPGTANDHIGILVYIRNGDRIAMPCTLTDP